MFQKKVQKVQQANIRFQASSASKGSAYAQKQMCFEEQNNMQGNVSFRVRIL